MAMTIPFRTFCPFWSPTSLKCSLCSEGLFIPLDDHIEAYCKTEEYPMCLQYNLSSESYLNSVAVNQAVGNDNRRQYQRVEGLHRITLVRLSASGKIASHFALQATTLDLSLGGLRLQAEEPLINDTVVQFSFDDLAPDFPLNGTATIKWCHRLIDIPEYQAGLAFCGTHTTEAMGMYLGIHKTRR